jgi:hypothetical protein
MPIWFNREGDHDHNGLIYALKSNVPLLKYIRALSEGEDPSEFEAEAREIAELYRMPFPTTAETARQPHPMVRPLVLRANLGEEVVVALENRIDGRWVGIHLVGGGYDVREDDGSEVGPNPPSLAPPGGHWKYNWRCDNQGVFPFHDGGNYSGGEDGTNVHGLFGALIVEPADAIWRDPVSGVRSTDVGQLDGLYLDVLPLSAQSAEAPEPSGSMKDHEFDKPCEYHDFDKEAHREFVIFFHDEPEFVPPHVEPEPDPCPREGGGHDHAGGHGGGHDGEGEENLLPIMRVSYRAEPMVNREQILFRLINGGHDFQGRPVLNEEQHHSSWMFGDPVTPILKAYIGDPVRIRFVHAAVKETHVFHLHLYEWHAAPEDPTSPRIDAISVSPQTAHTIEPVWGAGNRHQVAGDVIWHCHLYPHFHEGMWGMFRTFETLQDGEPGEHIASDDPVYKGRRIGEYPDGTPIERLLPLPDRKPPPRPTPEQPGFPLYIPGQMQQKSPIPPWPCSTPLRATFDYRPVPTDLERRAFNEQPVPGEMFTRHRFEVGQDDQWNYRPHNPDCDPPPSRIPKYELNSGRQKTDEIAVIRTRIDYNGYGWHDKDGHLYYRIADDAPAGDEKRPLFFRAQHGQILNLELVNRTPLEIDATEFDHAFPPCPERPWQGECSLHVHMVKFDPICADGASVGWNYMSAPVVGKRMIYRWWLDQEFGTIFFHDHLFANYRQKHGLFGALIVEPTGAQFWHPYQNRRIVSGLEARIRAPGRTREWFREFCIGIGDFIPMWDRLDRPLNPPKHPGGHGDQGVMGLDYRSDPIRERLRRGGVMVDPARWFSSLSPYHRDPYTVVFNTFENDPIWFRVVQGSHEEQHSFQVHGMRWRRFRDNSDSAVRNQQTFGVAEAFTFVADEPYGAGDYMYKLSTSDDLWLGCWGIVRAHQAGADEDETMGLRPLDNPASGPPPQVNRPVRRFEVTAVPKRIVYREHDLIDPFGLYYRLDRIVGPNGRELPVRQRDDNPTEPLILRCREGEIVELELKSELPPGIHMEPHAPEVPLDRLRRVSRQASMHADLVRFDVNESDGATVGRNRHQAASPGNPRTYRWDTSRPVPTPDNPNPNGGEPLGPILLQDMADFRNHRHHGLIGALIIEPPDATPLWVRPNAKTGSRGQQAWDGPRATLVIPGRTGRSPDPDRPGLPAERIEEAVLLMQDGLRLFTNGHPHMAVRDEPAAAGEDEPDHEDRGQKGFNYRSEPVWETPAREGEPPSWLSDDTPATPVFIVPENSKVRLHFIGAMDKPRNQSFTVHGVVWPEWRFLSGNRPMVASESALTTASTRTFEFKVGRRGAHAYRSGVLKWAVPQGLWGILRVE